MEKQMNKYEVTLQAQYEKTIMVYAATPDDAKEKTENILSDKELLKFTAEDFTEGSMVIRQKFECGAWEECKKCQSENVKDDELFLDGSVCLSLLFDDKDGDFK